ncbi:hypothetical protein QDK53_26935 [Amycolatopsis magusensis]|nr:hypothetical protein [Amycolatopsis magusensis]MDI5979857.1 hypothetical protein [Amycolatopsis magusensis]
MPGRQAAQRLTPDPDHPAGNGGQVVGEFADRPAGERPAELRRAGNGRRHDEFFLFRTEQAGTASRPPRVQTGQPDLGERMDHVPNVSSSAATNCAITGTRLPPAEANSIIAAGSAPCWYHHRTGNPDHPHERHTR